MNILKNTALLGKIALVLMLLAIVADLFTQGAFFNYIRLDTALTSQGEELWRLLTFPFVADSVPSTWLFIAVFVIVLPQLSSKIPKQIIAPLSLILVLMQGVLITLYHWESPFIYSGMDGLSIFYLVLTFLLVPNTRIYFLGRNLGKNSRIGLLLILMWGALQLISAEMSGTSIQDGLQAPIISLAFGSMAALGVFLNLKIANYVVTKRNLNTDIMPKVSPSKLKKVYAESAVSNSVDSFDSKFSDNQSENESLLAKVSSSKAFTTNDEALMNDLLEKIHNYGESSLSHDEKQTLLILSKKIN